MMMNYGITYLMFSFLMSCEKQHLERTWKQNIQVNPNFISIELEKEAVYIIETIM